MTRTRLAALTACLVLAACSGGDEVADGTTGTSEAPADDEAGGPTITIVDFDFGTVPEITAGSTLTVVNDDGPPHTMTAGDGTFDTGSISGGASAEVVVDVPGEYAFGCTIHPSMTGTLVVTG